MFRLSNNLIGILNFLTVLLSIPILVAGIWLRNHGTSDCVHFLSTPLIILGAFLLAVSIAGFLGACCGATLLLWIYLFVMFLLILAVLAFTVFAFVVTNKGAGEALSGRGYKQYRLGDYSDWLQKRVNDSSNWAKIKSCLIDAKVCSDFSNKYLNYTLEEFYSTDLSSVQSGCCKPPDDCGFTYVNPTDWIKTTTNSTDTDCTAWDNNPDVLCFNCSSCKAGVVDSIKSDWKKVAIIDIIFLVFLIIVYSVGCCAFRNDIRGK